MKCPHCNSKLRSDPPGRGVWYVCEQCNERFFRKGNRLYVAPYKTIYYEDGVVHEEDIDYGRCLSCGESLKGSTYVGPYEEVTNEYGFVRCKHCGYENIK
jgi:DNA-directed RNA polymerase subunit RPC12/RpoP